LGWDCAALNSALAPLKTSDRLAGGAVLALLKAQLASFKNPKRFFVVDGPMCDTSSKRAALAVRSADQTDFI
jgi:hypothetical protein